MTSKRINPIRGICVLPALPSWLAYTQGDIYHVKPYTGSDSNDGLSEDSPLASLVKAQSLVTADQNDIVLLYSESNSASTGGCYQIPATETAGLVWAKDGVHLIGINSGAPYGSRSGVRFASTFDTAVPMVTVSAKNCYIANIYFYLGVDGTTPLGALYITGHHNHFENCHIAGMGYAANVIANAYSMKLNGEENTFTDCIFGYVTQRGAQATTCEILTASSMTRPIFKNCIIAFGNATNATNHAAVRVAQGTMDFMLFDHCKFICGGTNAGGLAITYAFVVNANPGGTILLDHCSSAGITDWSNDCGFIWGPTYEATNGASTGGIGIVLIKT